MVEKDLMRAHTVSEQLPLKGCLSKSGDLKFVM